MPECADCGACVKLCPTGAISGQRFLLHAEKCYTLHSESPRPLPDEIPPPSPKCIMGCMRCQGVCPVNKGCLKVEKTNVVFTEEETQSILDADPQNFNLPQSVIAKHATLGLSENADLFCRNFRRSYDLIESR